MLNFNFSEKGLGLVSPPHFVYDFSRKMFPMLERVYMRPEVNSNRFEISLRGKISLRCKVTSLFAFT